MCYPHTCEARRDSVSQAEVQRFRKTWSPVQFVKSINKKIYSNGLHISRKLVRVTRKAKSKVVTVQRWVFNLTFAKIVLPLALFAFILLLHPHTEIQVGAVTTFCILFLLFLLCTSLTSNTQPHITKDDLNVTDTIKDVTTRKEIEASPLSLTFYSCLPLASMSRGWGWLTKCEFPQPLRILIIWIFAVATGCDRSESEFPLSQYRTLSDYFTRRLRPGVRPISVIGDLVSPADGSITVSSPLKHSGFTHLVKGLQYSLEIFLGSLDNIGPVIWDNDNDSGCIYDDATSEVSETSETPLLCPSLPAQFQLLLNNCDNSTQLYETTIYLSPGDYHRFHSPADWTVLMRRHFPGTMYSVSPNVVKMFPSLIATNERVAWYGRWKYGTFIMVAVAATNVGDIQTNFDNEVLTNNSMNVEETEKIYEKPISFSRGDEFGHFNFGSTIVLIYEAPQEIYFGAQPIRRVKMGESLFTWTTL